MKQEEIATRMQKIMVIQFSGVRDHLIFVLVGSKKRGVLKLFCDPNPYANILRPSAKLQRQFSAQNNTTTPSGGNGVGDETTNTLQ